MLSCNTVRDLLPSYLNHLTTSEMEAEIVAHLELCENCRRIRDTMVVEGNDKKIGNAETNFFKRKCKQKTYVLLTVVIMLLCMYGIYSMEYCVDVTNIASLEAEADECFDEFGFVSEFTESVKLGQMLFVQFRNIAEGAEQNQGILQLEPGILGKYRVSRVIHANWVLYINKIVRVGLQNYLLISGLNNPIGAETFRIYWNDIVSGTGSGVSVMNDSIGPIYAGRTASQLLLLQEVSEAKAEGLNWPFSIRYFDKYSKELCAQEILTNYDEAGKMQVSDREANVPKRMYSAFAIVLVVGMFFISHFLNSQKKEENEDFNEKVSSHELQ